MFAIVFKLPPKYFNQFPLDQFFVTATVITKSNSFDKTTNREMERGFDAAREVDLWNARPVIFLRRVINASNQIDE